MSSLYRCIWFMRIKIIDWLINIYPVANNFISKHKKQKKTNTLLIRYSRACGVYHEFLHRWLLLKRKLLNTVKLNISLLKLYGHHQTWYTFSEHLCHFYIPLIVITISLFSHSWLTIDFFVGGGGRVVISIRLINAPVIGIYAKYI